MSHKSKLPVSKNNIKCISKCYPKNTQITHPVTTELITNIYHDFCAIPKTDIDGTEQIIDACDLPSSMANDDKLLFQTKLDILYPIIDFNPYDFLNAYYKIKDISDFYAYLREHKNIPVFTKLRIIDCFIISFGKDTDVIEDIFSDTIIDIVKKFWIKKMYGVLCQYVTVVHNDGKPISPSNNKLKKSDDVAIRTKYIVSTVATPQNIFEITNKYFTDIQSNDDAGIDNFYEFLLRSLEEKLNDML